jgi:hypothetical protein
MTLMAQLHGKLASDLWITSEDLLTSAVFGTIKNLRASVFSQLLSSLQPLEGARLPVLFGPLSWSFWPWWDTCEPDVVIEDDRNLYVIEAKLYSDFGEDSNGPSQLRREWSDGFVRAENAAKNLWLITVTNHATLPTFALRRQLTNSDADPTRVCWLSWSNIGLLLLAS